MPFLPEVRRAVRALQKNLQFARFPAAINTDGSINITGKYRNIEFRCDVHLGEPDPQLEIVSMYADCGRGTGRGNGKKVRVAMEAAARDLGLPKVTVYKGARRYWQDKAGYERTGEFPKLFEKHV